MEQETEQTHASSENDEPMAPTPASVSVGNSTLKSTLSTERITKILSHFRMNTV